MNKSVRLSIELKTPEELKLKRQAHSKAISEKTNLRSIVLKALKEFCEK